MRFGKSKFALGRGLKRFALRALLVGVAVGGWAQAARADLVASKTGSSAATGAVQGATKGEIDPAASFLSRCYGQKLNSEPAKLIQPPAESSFAASPQVARTVARLRLIKESLCADEKFDLPTAKPLVSAAPEGVSP